MNSTLTSNTPTRKQRGNRAFYVHNSALYVPAQPAFTMRLQEDFAFRCRAQLHCQLQPNLYVLVPHVASADQGHYIHPSSFSLVTSKTTCRGLLLSIQLLSKLIHVCISCGICRPGQLYPNVSNCHRFRFGIQAICSSVVVVGGVGVGVGVGVGGVGVVVVVGWCTCWC